MTIQQLIEAKLTAALSPSVLEVINESHMHRVEPGSESHFKVVIVSEHFSGQRLLARHRQVNSVLADELAGAVHALALHTYTETEWQEKATPRAPRAALANRHSPETGCTTGFPSRTCQQKLNIFPHWPRKGYIQGGIFRHQGFLLIVETKTNTPIEVSK